MEFTPRAKKAFSFAEAESRSAKHPSVGSHHLVFGLFLLGSGVHFSILKSLGCTEASLRSAIGAIGPLPETKEQIEGYDFGISAVQALQRAGHEASAMSFTYVGTEHILLGLLSEVSGPAATLFTSHHADTAQARKAILDELRQA